MSNNGGVFTWGGIANNAYGQALTNFTVSYVLVLGEKGVGSFDFVITTFIPWTPQPNWTNIIFTGNIGSPTLGLSGIKFMNNSVVFEPTAFSNWVPYLPLNSTSTVLIITPSYYILLCNWTVIGPVNPQIALRLPAPMGVLLNEETWYLVYGNYDAPAWYITWVHGYGTWRFSQST